MALFDLQEPAALRIREAATRGALSHALLLTGSGARLELARYAAAAMECEAEGSRPCGVCRACRKVEEDIHPDVITVRDDEHKNVSVSVIREMRADAYIRPNEGKRKVYIVDPADSMNETAQNALLKVLEEGPQYAAFLLVAGEPGRLLETIRSRCEQLVLPPEEELPNPEQLAKAEKLAHLLLNGDELAVVEGITALEQEKLKSGELALLLAITERCVAEELASQPRRAVTVLKALKTCRDNQIYNPGPGHTLGWLVTELFR